MHFYGICTFTEFYIFALLRIFRVTLFNLDCILLYSKSDESRTHTIDFGDQDTHRYMTLFSFQGIKGIYIC
jgi:hypothetical protein